MSHEFTTLNLLGHNNHNSSQWLLELGPLLKKLKNSATNVPNQQLLKKIAK